MNFDRISQKTVALHHEVHFEHRRRAGRQHRDRVLELGEDALGAAEPEARGRPSAKRESISDPNRI